jgi:hypothetical protein
LQNNSFTGTIPHHLNLYHLYYLDLGHNQLTGTVPADWLDYANGLVALRHLYLDHNKFTGSLPSNFTSTLGTGRLFELYLSDNQFTGTVPGGVPDPFQSVLLDYLERGPSREFPNGLQNLHVQLYVQPLFLKKRGSTRSYFRSVKLTYKL